MQSLAHVLAVQSVQEMMEFFDSMKNYRTQDFAPYRQFLTSQIPQLSTYIQEIGFLEEIATDTKVNTVFKLINDRLFTIFEDSYVTVNGDTPLGLQVWCIQHCKISQVMRKNRQSELPKYVNIFPGYYPTIGEVLVTNRGLFVTCDPC
jgi:hypothetical protein